MTYFLYLISFIYIFLFSTCYSNPIHKFFNNIDSFLFHEELSSNFFPKTYNSSLSTGYIFTPSSRSGNPGDFRGGINSFSCFSNTSFKAQLFQKIDLGFSYRYNTETNFLEKTGSGKLVLYSPEKTDFYLPGFAIGFDNYSLQNNYFYYYLVATQILEKINTEFSLGLAKTHSLFKKKTIFGAISFYPFRSYEKLSSFCMIYEYSPIIYDSTYNKHSNFSLKYHFKDFFHFTLFNVGFKKWGGGISIQYPLSQTYSFLPKKPRNKLHPITITKKEDFLENYYKHLKVAFKNYGFNLTTADFKRNKTLHLKMRNIEWKDKASIIKNFRQCIVENVYPEVEHYIVTLESYNLPYSSFSFSKKEILKWKNKDFNIHDFHSNTKKSFSVPQKDSFLDSGYTCKNQKFLSTYPSINTFFGQKNSFLKYQLIQVVSLKGFLPKNSFYNLTVNLPINSNLRDVNQIEFYKPTSFPNVITDYLSYIKSNNISLSSGYIQKNDHIYNNLYSRISLGYYQINYGGVSLEILSYPIESSIALGLEASIAWKRNYKGFGFTKKLRKIIDNKEVFYNYSHLYQYFFNVYFNLKNINLVIHPSFGRFLGGDFGSKLEFYRYFKNGLKLSGWFSVSNAGTMVNEKTFYDKGLKIEIPLDLFSRKRHKESWSYSSAFILRDCGYKLSSGIPLFNILTHDFLS